MYRSHHSKKALRRVRKIILTSEFILLISLISKSDSMISDVLMLSKVRKLLFFRERIPFQSLVISLSQSEAQKVRMDPLPIRS